MADHKRLDEVRDDIPTEESTGVFQTGRLGGRRNRDRGRWTARFIANV